MNNSIPTNLISHKKWNNSWKDKHCQNPHQKKSKIKIGRSTFIKETEWAIHNPKQKAPGPNEFTVNST